MTEHQDQGMNVVDHLDELRNRVLIVAGAFIVFLILGFVFVEDIYQWFLKDTNIKLTILSPTEIIWVYFMLAGIIGISGMIPILAWQIWLFVRPGLTESERKITLAYIPALFILFIVGLMFGYFIIFPIIFNFLMSLSADIVNTMFTTEKYFKFILQITVPFGVLFELPIVVMFLTSIGVIDPYKLRKIRKYAIFALAIISALVTPPDFLSQILVLIPLVFLYECSIILSKFVYRKRLKKIEKEALKEG